MSARDSNEDGTAQTIDTPTGMKVSLKNTFLNVDDGASDLSMPDLLRAQTTPAVYNALQALYSNSSGLHPASNLTWSLPMDPVSEIPMVDEMPPPPLDEVLRQISETLSAMNFDASEPLPSTTVMLRNIPNKYTADKLVEQFISQGFLPGEEFDFFYLPIDFRNKCNVGYAFLNFKSQSQAEVFMSKMEGYRLPATNSFKVCSLCWARVQGKDANISHYKDSPILPEYRPWLFNPDGTRDVFPDPDPEKMVVPVTTPTAIKGPDCNKIFVGGLDKTITGADIVSYFENFGPVRDGAVVIDRTSGKSRGFGFCLFEKSVPRSVWTTASHTIKGLAIAIKPYESSSPSKPTD